MGVDWRGALRPLLQPSSFCGDHLSPRFALSQEKKAIAVSVCVYMLGVCMSVKTVCVLILSVCGTVHKLCVCVCVHTDMRYGLIFVKHVSLCSYFNTNR